MATSYSLAPVKYGTVVGRFLSFVADTPDDEDDEPDFVALAGEVTFTPVVKALLVADAVPSPATVLPTPITGILDSAGVLHIKNPDGLPVAPAGVTLVATDDTAVNPVGWTYRVSFKLKLGAASISYDAFTIDVPAGKTIDLATAAPVPSTSGSPIVRGPAGEGVPEGGTTGQVLGKTSADDYATAWVDAPSGGGGASTVDAISDAGAAGKSVLKAADAAAARAAIDAVPSTRKIAGKALTADVSLTAGDVGAQPAGSYATAAQGAKADTAVQPAAMAGKLDAARMAGLAVQVYDHAGQAWPARLAGFTGVVLWTCTTEPALATRPADMVVGDMIIAHPDSPLATA